MAERSNLLTSTLTSPNNLSLHCGQFDEAFMQALKGINSMGRVIDLYTIATFLLTYITDFLFLVSYVGCINKTPYIHNQSLAVSD